MLGKRSILMDSLRARLTEGSAQCTTIEANQFGFRLFTSLTNILVKWTIIFSQFIGNLFFLSHNMTIVNHPICLSCTDLFDICINHEINGPSEHILNGIHLSAIRAFIKELFWDLSTELASLLLH